MNLKSIFSFFKKKKPSPSDGESDSENGVKGQENGSFQRLRKKIRFTLKRRGSGKKDGGDDAEGTDKEGAKENKLDKKAKKQAKKEEKKRLAQEKKKKKSGKKKPDKKGGSTEPSQQSGGQDSGGGGKSGGKKRRVPILAIAIIGASLIVGGAIFGAVAYMNIPSQEELLLRATLLRNDEKYSSAEKIYKRLLKKDPALVQAHLGLADALAGQNKGEEAINSLNDALVPTGSDPVILAKIEYLSEAHGLPIPPMPDGAVPTASDTATSSDTAIATPADIPDPVPIVWKDAALEKAVREAMEIPPGTPVTDIDAAGLTMLKILGANHAATDESLNSVNKLSGYELGGVLYTERGTIRTLDDLAYFKNLKKLIIGYNSVEDISGVAELASLDTLGLYFNNISDIKPIAGLKDLRFIYMYNNNIADISPISGLTELRQLWISTNRITDISPVKNLNQLVELYIGHNQVTDISPVSGLSELGFLFAENNNISDISPIANLKNLSDVSFVGNPVSDYSPASHVTNVN